MYHLGCAPKYFPEVKPEAGLTQTGKVAGIAPVTVPSLTCPAVFSMASPAADNLVIPPYSYESDNVVVVGVDEENA